MVFKKGKKAEESPETESKEEPEEEKKFVPVFLSYTDVKRLTYENNVMLQEILTILKEELNKEE